MLFEINTKCSLQCISDSSHIFFGGYYDKRLWDWSQRYILVHQPAFEGRRPTPEDKIIIGLIDTANNNQFKPLCSTYAWNWQQGAMLEWWPGDPDNKIIFNDRRKDKFVSVILDVFTKKEKVLPLPIAGISHNGQKAISFNFSRLADERPGYGYEGIPDKYKNDFAPAQDGIFIMDMQTGNYDLIISLEKICRVQNRIPFSKHRFNHVMFSPNDKRFVFFHRWRCKEGEFDYPHYTEVFTADLDGGNIYCINDHDMTSHYDWYDNQWIGAFARRKNIGDKYFLFKDMAQEINIIGDEKLSHLGDGHCSFSPDRRWMLSDTYPDKNSISSVFLYNLREKVRVDLGKFYTSPYEGHQCTAELRCDLHPRWNRDGKKICFDSTHTGKRQMYVMDLTDVLRDF